MVLLTGLETLGGHYWMCVELVGTVATKLKWEQYQLVLGQSYLTLG